MAQPALIEEIPRPQDAAVPPQVRAALDALFDDADRHGPRWRDALLPIFGGSMLFLVTFAAACAPRWRSFVIDATGTPGGADVLLVVPVLVALVVFITTLAPLARLSMAPLFGVGAASLGLAAWLVDGGSVVAATMPAVVGGALVGISLARALRRAVWALPVLLAAGVSDAQSVQGGVTHSLLDDVGAGGGAASATVEPTLQIAANAVASVDYVVLHIPVASGMWILGIVDVLALGVLLGLTHLFWLPMGRTLVALAAALVVTVAAGGPVPVLPALGLAWAIVHARLVWRSTRFSLRRLVYIGG